MMLRRRNNRPEKLFPFTRLADGASVRAAGELKHGVSEQHLLRVADMRRAIPIASFCILSAAAFAPGVRSSELCLVCEEPAASYRCNVERPSTRFDLGDDIEREICAKVLAKQGEHGKCQRVEVPEGGTCKGPSRTVTLTDYQRVVSGNGESTYEVGALEIARRNVHNTWLCVTSMFKDC